MTNDKNVQQRAGEVIQDIDEQIIRVPSKYFLWAALSSMVVSLMLQLMGFKDKSLFIGQWAPSFLILSVYSRLTRKT